ncbi:hypothetical protein C8T65DRAFT_724933, partial [Cerioporus squamosus]
MSPVSSTVLLQVSVPPASLLCATRRLRELGIQVRVLTSSLGVRIVQPLTVIVESEVRDSAERDNRGALDDTDTLYACRGVPAGGTAWKLWPAVFAPFCAVVSANIDTAKTELTSRTGQTRAQVSQCIGRWRFEVVDEAKSIVRAHKSRLVQKISPALQTRQGQSEDNSPSARCLV